MKIKYEKLSNLCNSQIGKTPSRKTKEYWGKGSPWVAISDLKQKYICKTKEQITQIAIDKTNCKVIPKGTLLMSFKLSIGKLAFTKCDLFTNEAIVGLSIKDNDVLDKNYLYYALKNIPLLKGAKVAVKGNTLNKKSLGNLRIPLLPSLDDQKRIASLLTQVETLIAKREESIELLDELLRSSFLDMFKEYTTLDYKLEELCSEIVDCPHSTPKYSNEKTEFSCLRTSEFSNGHIDYSSMKYVNEEEYLKRVKRLVPQFGDVLYAREGSYGDAVRVPKKSLICLGQRTMLFRPNIEICNSIFLWALVRSDMVFRQAKKKNKGATVGRVNVKDIKNFKVYLPPKPLQDKFATIVKQVESTKEQYQKSLDELRDLFGSLSQRAFRGELDLSNMKLPIVINIKSLKKKEQTTDDIIKMASSISQMNKTMLESIKKESSMYVLAQKEMMKRIEEDFKQVAINNWQNEQKKIDELANLGKYNESILNFTNEYKSLVKPSFNVLNSTGFNLNNYEKEFKLSTIENFGLEALQKSLEINQPYKLALERAEAMNPLRGWGERHEALINRYSEKLEETTEVIESIPNLSELMDDELFDDISWTDSYDDIKELVYKLLDEGKLEQVFDKDKKRVVLKKVEQ